MALKELVEEHGGGGGTVVGLGDGPFGDRIVSGEVLAGRERHIDGVELDDLAGFGGLGEFGQAFGLIKTSDPNSMRIMQSGLDKEDLLLLATPGA